MRLVVGPLPAAVYWRRRIVVLISLAMVVLVVSYACGGPDASTAESSDGDPSPSPTQSLQQPYVPNAGPTSGNPGPPSTPAATTSTPGAFVLPNPANTGPCLDTELEVTATAASGQVTKGVPVDVTIRIKNISPRTCSRDLGADVQELRLMSGDIVVWSSDDCNPRKGNDVRSIGAGKDVSFTSTWGGRRSRTGTGDKNCDAPAPEQAEYHLVARLDQKLSTPFALRIQ